MLLLDLALPRTTRRVLLYLKPVSAAWGMNRLERCCREEMGVEPEVGLAFLFINRAQDRLRIYFRTERGSNIVEKVLLRGGFMLPAGSDGQPYVDVAVSKLPSLFRSAPGE